MKLRITLTILLFISLNAIAQIKFENGYIINNNDEKIDCLIKNEDWLHNPTSFLYKINKNAKEITGTLSSIKEFGVNGLSKYKKFKVNVDKSGTNVNQLSNKRTYDFVVETLFLKALVAGSANLYVYDEGSFVKYFYAKKNTPIKQLEYKEYLNSTGLLVKNKNYLTQLRLDVSCNNLDYKNIKYKKNSLVDYFLAYNNCNGNSNIVEDFTASNKKDDFNLIAKFGIGNATITPSNNTFGYGNIESNGINLRMGIEAEYILPFNKNKWSIFIEPTYQTYKGDIEGTQSGEITYNSIEVPLGVKHYMFLNNKAKLFLSAAYVLDFTMNSKIDFKNLGDLEVTSSSGTQIGLGYNYNNKYTLEARYNMGRDLTQNYSYWKTNYSAFSIILGYKFL